MTDVLVRPPSPADAGPFDGSVAEDLVLAVATSAGKFQPARGLTASTRLRAGDVIGQVTGLGEPTAICCPVDAEVGDLLVRPGQTVARGQGLAWLRREEA
jgi:biotin carboxyl carrier protein